MSRSLKRSMVVLVRALAYGQKNAVLRRGSRTRLSNIRSEAGEFCGGTAFFRAGAEPPDEPHTKYLREHGHTRTGKTIKERRCIGPASVSRPCPVWRQGRYRQCRPHRTGAGVLPAAET